MVLFPQCVQDFCLSLRTLCVTKTPKDAWHPRCPQPCASVFFFQEFYLSNPTAELTPAADRILLYYKSCDLQPRGAAKPGSSCTAAGKGSCSSRSEHFRTDPWMSCKDRWQNTTEPLGYELHPINIGIVNLFWLSPKNLDFFYFSNHLFCTYGSACRGDDEWVKAEVGGQMDLFR